MDVAGFISDNYLDLNIYHGCTYDISLDLKNIVLIHVMLDLLRVAVKIRSCLL
jgi:hypothetical protein